MNYGLRLPCKVALIQDATHYTIQLPGQSEIDVMLPLRDILVGPELLVAVSVIARRIKSCVKPVVVLPQPQNDMGWFRQLKEGSCQFGDIELNGELLSEYLVGKKYAVRIDDGEWNGGDMVQRWTL